MQSTSSKTHSDEPIQVPPLSFSDNAVAKVSKLIDEEGNKNLNLRLYITGGGCSGFSYGFTFDENIKEGDTVVEKKGIRLIVDSMSVQYLMGATVDYIEGLQGSRFTVDNPNASSQCGCGSSFSI